MDKKLKDILAKNEDLRSRVETGKWSITYNKKADMVIMGEDFPANSFYYPVIDSGVMLRIDDSERIYGFAIENAKFFMKRNPEAFFALSFVVYPYRTFITRPIYFTAHQASKGLDNTVKKIFAISNYIAGKAVYC